MPRLQRLRPLAEYFHILGVGKRGSRRLQINAPSLGHYLNVFVAPAAEAD